MTTKKKTADKGPQAEAEKQVEEVKIVTLWMGPQPWPCKVTEVDRIRHLVSSGCLVEGPGAQLLDKDESKAYADSLVKKEK